MGERVKWVVVPWFDEGEDWPAEPGAEVTVEAADEEAARDEWRRLNPDVVGIFDLDVRRA